MFFTKHLREPIRIWQRPHAKIGTRYRMDAGEIVILSDITQDLAIESGFESRADLLRTAKHGPA